MSRLSLRLFGSPEARFDDRALSFRTRKAFALLAYLAVEPGQHSRERLSTLLWPESDATLGRASLRNTLGYLHTALNGADPAIRYLVATRDALGFDPVAPCDLDLAAMQRATAALRAGELPRDALLSSLQAALDTYRGDFLAGFSLDDAPEFDDWASLQRETWHRRMADLADRYVGLLVDGGELARAIEAAQRWSALDRLNETALRRLIALHLASGDRAAALRAFESGRAVLSAELGIAPEPATLALAERARAPLPAAPAPKVEATGRAHADSPLLALSTAPLVGRAAEFGALIAAYESARQGHAVVATLEGEPGIGKTRLAHDFLGWAAAQGATVLIGQGFETGGRLPYQPLIDALRRLDAATPFSETVGERTLAELSRLLPELRERAPSLPPPSGDEAVAQSRLFDAVAELGQTLATHAPLLLHLDDLQWADAATLDLLAYVIRRWAERGVSGLILLGVRTEGLAQPDGARPALGEWLVSNARIVPLVRLALAPLTASDTAQLVAALSGGRWTVDGGQPATNGQRFTDWLFGETGGQPFYLLETLKTLLVRGAATVQHGPGGAWVFDFSAVSRQAGVGDDLVPPSVRELILRQLQRLAPPAFALLVAGAVLGHSFDFPQLCQAAGLDEDAGLLALDQVLAARLLREADARTDTYAFVHDRIRDVTYTDAGEARRRVFHRRALAALQERGAPPAELARHALAAGLALPALRFTIAAGDAALRLFAVRDAIAHYTAARDALGSAGAGDIPFAEQEALLLQLARAHELLSQFPQARAVYEELIALARHNGTFGAEWVALQRLLMMTSLAGQGDLDEVIALAEGALRQAEERDDRALLAEMTWTLAQLSFYNITPQRSIAHGERALALARPHGRWDLLARCLNVLAVASLVSGRSRAALAYAEEARALFAAHGDRALEADNLSAIATARLHLGESRAAVEAARAAVAICREIANPWGEVWAASHFARTLLDVGEYGQAFEIATQALRMAREQDHPLLIGVAATIAGAVQRTLFAFDEAIVIHNEALRADEKIPVKPHREALLGELITAHALREDWPAAYAHARELLAGRRYVFYYYGGLTRWHGTSALLHGGDPAAAAADLRRFAASLGDHHRYRLPLHRARAVLAAWHGDSDAALAELTAAAALAATIGLPGERWSILAALVAQQRQRGDLAAAASLTAEARAIIDRLAATLPPGPIRDQFLTGAYRTLTQT